MSFIDLVLISLALSCDAFGVALSLGLNCIIKNAQTMIISSLFGFFQFLFVFLGGLFGYLFNEYIFSLPSIFGGIIILIVGMIMFKEGFSNNEISTKINLSIIILLSICVSIDALMIGFSTFSNLNFKLLFSNSLFVGITTFFMSLTALFISKNIKKIKLQSNIFNLLASILLIFLGIKIIFF